jgi:gliding motility-associated-like protein
MKNYKDNIIVKSLTFIMLVVFGFQAQAQSTLVLNGGVTVLDGGTAGTPVYLVVNEPNPAGITRYGGHIHSENQYNFVKWMSGASTGSYVYPFGVGGTLTNYIPFTFNKTAGTSEVDMSTWTTDVQNMPHAAATNVGPVTSMTGAADSVLYAIDRFWDIQTSAATTADLTFSYLGIENTTSAPTDTVKAMHWNGTSWDAAVNPGNPGVVAGVGTAGPFVGQTTFSPWILAVVSPCPTAAISYPMDYCYDDTTTHQVILSGDTTGIYSATPTGLTIDSLTGAIVPATSTPGTYTVSYTIDSSAVCPVYVTTTTVTIIPPTITNQNVSICQGDSILLGGAFQTSAGVFNDTLTGLNTCDSIVISTLTITPPTLTNVNDSICQGDSILLGGAFQTTAGIYNDTLVGVNTCDSIVITTLSITPPDTTSQTVLFCAGDSVFVGGAFQTLPGMYTDTLTGTNTCDSIVTTNLVLDSVLLAVADTFAPVCFGDPINLTATGSGNGTITWYSDPNGTTVIGTGSPFSTTVPAPGTYTFYVNEDGNCPSAMDSVVVVVGGVQAIINANPLTGPVPLSVFFGNGSTTGAGITYFWDFGNGNTSTNFEPTEVYNDEGVYTVMLIVTDGVCSDTAYVTIDAYGASAILIPNVFTPNGDGSNDVFTVDGVNLVSVQCEIFNRWGQLLYSWDNVKGAWDGRTLSGALVPDGTYFYIVTAEGADGEEFFKKGGFSLIR